MLNPAQSGLLGGTLAFVPLLYTTATALSVTEWLPASMFSSWSEDGTNITVPIASFEDLTAAAADATTGDARQVALSMCFTMTDWYKNLTVPPEAFVATVRNRKLQTSGDFSGEEKITFQFEFHIGFIDQLISDEPA